MPIRAELRHFYGREWRTVVRPRILARAGNRCEQCGVPNLVTVFRAGGWWRDPDLSRLAWFLPDGRRAKHPPDDTRMVRIVLTVAHLNHTPGDDRDENLKALCQWCHLNHDQAHHHETRAARKDAARPLFNLTGSERRPTL